MAVVKNKLKITLNGNMRLNHGHVYAHRDFCNLGTKSWNECSSEMLRSLDNFNDNFNVKHA